MNAPVSAGRRPLWRWLGWFTAANGVLYLLVSLRYLQGYHWPDSLPGAIYVPLAMIGQSTVLAVLPAVLLIGWLIAIRPMRRAVMTGAVLIAALGLTLLVLDTNVFVERRLHLSLFIAQLFEPVTWIASAAVLGIALAFESLLAGMLWRWLAARPQPAGGRWIGTALALAWFASQGLHVWADAVAHGPVTRLTSYLPLYYPLEAKRTLARLGLIDPERVQQAVLERRSADAAEEGDLRYPLAPLQCVAAAGAPLNVLWIVIDALRPDAVDATLMPALMTLRAASQAFDNHWSGGNSSRMGAFSMFYGLPSTYFRSFYSAQRPPVLLDQFRARDYEPVAVSAVGFGSPTLIDRTVVAGVPTLISTLDEPAAGRNEALTRKFEDWFAARAADRPFFALLWYSPTDRNAAPLVGLARDDRYALNPRADELWNGYRQGMHQIDGEIAQVLASLDQAGRASDTLVIVTSDHGYEFDDLGLGHYGHASNYGAPQLRSLLQMRWPGREPRAFVHRSSHLDLPATLLQELFGCRNPPSDYSMGRNLFDGVSWDWIIAGSYHSYAIVQPDRILVSYPGGFTEVLGPDMQPPLDSALDAALIERALAEMRRFYR